MLKIYITGADRGLGLGMTQVLLKRGHLVYAGSFMPQWPELKKLQKKYSENLKILTLDVASDASVLAAAAKIKADTDSLNWLINNAGMAQDRSGTLLEPQYYDDIRKLFEINTIGPLRVTKSVLELILAASGEKALINISSLAGSIGKLERSNQIGYTMSKAALNMQTKSAYNNLHEKGVKVLAFHPGWMHSHVFGDLDLMKDAPLQPIEAAKDVLAVIEKTDLDDEAIYKDHQGQPMPW